MVTWFRLPLGYNAYLLVSSNIVSSVWKTNEAKAENIILLILVCVVALIVGVWGVMECGRKGVQGKISPSSLYGSGASGEPKISFCYPRGLRASPQTYHKRGHVI